MLLLIAAVMYSSLPALAQSSKPNVVLIVADDLGYGDIGCYGQAKIATPNIDRLAKGGMKFTHFYAGTSVCAPSRASLMTGLHTGHTPIRGNYEIEPEGQLPLPGTAFTIAELFKNAGYATGDFGKWGLGFVGSSGDPVKQGFDTFFGYNCQRQSHNYFPDHLWHNDQRIDYPNTPTNQKDYAGDVIQQQALSFMADNKNKPFFLFLSYTLPHAALQLPKGDTAFEAYKKKFNEQPKPVNTAWNGTGYQPQAYPHAAYAAMVARLDEYVGQVVEKLKTLGLEKNTLIIFTSDNGPHAEGGNDPEFFNSNGGFRGIKRSLYEGGIRVPMIACWPGVVKSGTVSDQVGAFWDFLPTFAALTKQSFPSQTDGISLLPALTGKGNQKQHEYLYWEFHEEGGRQAVRMGNWKGVRQNARKNPDAPVEVYNLEKDPSETTDMAAQQPAIAQQLKSILQKAHVENKDFPFVEK